MIRGCIFDLDGVIVDTARYHYLAWRKLANDLGFDFSEENNERLKGVSRMDSLEILLEVGGLSLPDPQKLALSAAKNSDYLTYIEKMTQADVLPGVTRFLDVLRSAGMKIALGTASKNALTILHRIGLSNAFDSIVDGNRVTKAKPNPEVFLIAADDLGLEPCNCLVFEDAVAGIEAAHRAGMKCIGIGRPEILRKADHVIPDFINANLELVNF